VAGELGWPWAGWSTPFWMVLVAFVGLVALAGLSWWLVTRRRRPRVQA
jgi:LPXTG-motif cell wall-anchored protein